MELKMKPGSATTNIAIGAVCLVFLIVIIVGNAAMGSVVSGGLIMGAALGGSFGLVIGIIRYRWANKPVATIDANGITPHPLPCGTIPWQSIRGAEVRRLMFARQLIVETTHPMKRAPFSVAMGVGMSVVNRKDHNRLSLGLGPLDRKPEDVQAEIAKHFKTV